MEHHTQGTPNHNGQHIDTVSVGVPVAVLNSNTEYGTETTIKHRGRVENHYYSCRPVDTCTDRGHVKPYGTEWRNIPTTHAQHQGRGGTMARPFPFMADTPSEKWRENNPSGTPRHLTRKQSNVRNF